MSLIWGASLEYNSLCNSEVIYLVFSQLISPDVISLADKAIQRGLYNLNMSKQFNMKSLNEKYSYDEDGN